MITYGHLSNPNVGSVLPYQEAFQHAFHFSQDDPRIESYETNSGVLSARARMDMRLWLNEHFPGTHRVHAHHRLVVFKNQDDAMRFKLVWG